MNKVDTKQKHIGRSISQIRDSRGMKQEDLGIKVGLSQQTVSKYEQMEELDENILEKLAKGLGVEVDYIHSFVPDSKGKVINNTFTAEVNNGGQNAGENFTINPIDELIASYKDQLKMQETMYERLLSEKDKVIQALQSRK